MHTSTVPSHAARSTTVDAAVGTWQPARALALLHVLAEPSHVARIVWWLKGSGRRAPAARGAQRALRLCCVRAGRAVSASSTCHREAEARSSITSTARIVPKPASHSRHRWLLQLLTLQRRRRMDAAAHVEGPSHGCALQIQRSPMQFVASHRCALATNGSRPPSLWSPGSREGPSTRCAPCARI